MEFLDYTPDPAILSRLCRVNFAALIGPTAAGKTTLLEAAIKREPSIHLVTVTTSRAIRPGERDGIDYHFRSQATMRRHIGRGSYVQVAPKAFDDIYATAPEDYSTDGLAAMAVIADAMPTFLALPFRRIRQIFVLPPDWETWQTRILSRNFTPEQNAKRMSEAGRSLVYAVTTPNIIFVVNDELEKAAGDMQRALLQGKGSIPLAEGRKRAKTLLEHLKNTHG